MTDQNEEHLKEYVTATVGGQLFGLPILRVQDVFAPARITRVPLAAPEIAGVLNLRGRIVTLIDLRCRLGLGTREDNSTIMAIGVESQGESYGLLIDAIGEVLKLDETSREPNPANLDPETRHRVGRRLSPGRAIARRRRCRSRPRHRREGGRGVTALHMTNQAAENTRANMMRLSDENLFGR